MSLKCVVENEIFHISERCRDRKRVSLALSAYLAVLAGDVKLDLVLDVQAPSTRNIIHR